MSLGCPSCGTDNPPQARFCFSCATPLTDPLPARLERKFATALFADLVGSTEFAEREDPEVVRSVIGQAFDRLSEVIEAHGGVVEKFIGDAVLGVFGIPAVHEDDPERAVRAGLQMQSVLARQNSPSNEAKPQLSMRIGIEAGEILADLERVGGSRDRMVTGDAVNTAARLQAGSAPGGVLVGPVAHAASKAAIEYRALPPLSLKGKSEPVPAWAALRVKPGPRVERSQIGLQARLVGRDEELALLEHNFRRVRAEGRPALVTILGPAGVGKSRLAAEFFHSLQELPEPVSWRKGRCVAYGNLSYSALADAVRDECGVLQDDSLDVAAAKIKQAVEVLIGDAALGPPVQALVGATVDHAFSREELFDAWRTFLERMAERESLVLVLEDLHWADDGLLDFVDHLSDWARGRIMILTLARSELLERKPSWGGGKRNYSAIYLDPLTAEETGMMLEDILGAPPPEDLLRLVIDRSEGNPLFEEEIVRMLIDRGIIRSSEAAGWQVSEAVEAVEIPRSVQALMAARLDALPREEKAVLQDAAVIGRTFWNGAVGRLSGTPEDRTRDVLKRLQGKELLVPRGPAAFSGEAEFAFRHALIRDVAYDSLPKSLRADKHVEFAGWAEEHAGERREEIAELLASHYLHALGYLEELGGSPERRHGVERQTYRWAQSAGGRALRLWQRREAVRWYRTALDRAERIGVGHEELANVSEAYAGACEGVQPYSEVARAFEKALTLYEELGDQRAAGRVEAWLAFVAFHSGDQDAVGPRAERALARLEPLGESRDLALALTLLGWYHRRLLQAEKGEPLFRRAKAMAERVGDRATQVWAMVGLGRLLYRAGKPDEGFSLLEDALGLAKDVGDLPLLLRAYIDLSEAYEEARGDYARAEALLREGVELARRSGHLAQVAWMEGNLSDYLFDRGELHGEVEQAARRGLEAARAVGEVARIGYTLVAMAARQALRLELGEAEGTLEEVRAILPRAQDPYLQGWEPLVAAWIAQGRGRAEDVPRILLKGVETLGDRVLVWGGQNLLLECVRCLASLGRPAEAFPSRERLARLASWSAPAKAFLLWVDGLLETDAARARDVLAQAVSRFAALGRRLDQGRCLIDLAEAELRLGRDPLATVEAADDMLGECGAILFIREVEHARAESTRRKDG